MKVNNNEKRLVRTHESLFEKIKRFFRNLLKKNVENITIDKREETEFKKNIQIKQDEEEKRISELQQDFKKGNIDESEIEENDYSKLIKLYDEQNEKLRQEIEMYKMQTAKILTRMKNE